ncbi:urease accessory protein UreE [Synechococcus sp. R60.4]|jgi:urease accessory protein|uniref:urease accessory protein UreE n=1 Tax=unclassified Synechococcus TaxID=2626047 RepID=UPI000162A9F1|nr:urease accessory protein UreE [uncultured bacterium]
MIKTYVVTHLRKMEEGIPEGLQVVDLPMTSEERTQVRRRLETPSGLVLNLALPTGTVLRPGQILCVVEGVAYRVVAAPEEVLVIYPRSLKEAAQVGHLIGNLHRPIDLSGEGIAILYDAALEERLRNLGLVVVREMRSFAKTPLPGHSH